MKRQRKEDRTRGRQNFFFMRSEFMMNWFKRQSLVFTVFTRRSLSFTKDRSIAHVFLVSTLGQPFFHLLFHLVIK